MTIASLIVDIQANTATLVKGVEQVNANLDKVGSAAVKMGAALGIGFSVGAVVSFAKSTFDAASQIHDMAEQVGISSEALQGFKEAAELSGAHLEDVTTAIQKMNKNLDGGDKATVDALKAAHLSFAAIRDMKPEDAFLAITDAIQRIPDPMIQSNVALTLFGKGAGALLPGIKEGFRQAADAADKMSNDTIDTLEAAQDAWDKLGKKVTIVTGTMLATVINTTKQITESVSGFGMFVDNVIKYGVGGAVAMADAQEKAAKAAAQNRDINLALPGPIHKTKEELEAAAKAAAEHAKAIQELTDRLGGNGAMKASKDLAEALDKLGGISKLSASAIGRFGEEAAKLRDEGAPLTAQLRELAHVHDLVAVAAANAKIAAAEEEAAWKQQNKTAGEYIANLPTAIFQTRSFAGSVQQVSAAAASYQGNLAYATEATYGWGDAVKDTLSQFAKDMSSGHGVLGSLKMIGTDIATDFTSNLLGAIPVVGQAIAQFAKPIVDGFKKLFGSLFGTAGRDAVVTFANTFGGFDALHAKLLTLGAAGEQLWIKLTQGVGRNSPQQAQQVIDQINAALKGQDDYMSRLPGLIDKYGLSWADAGQQAKQAHLDEIAQGLIQDFADLSRAGFDVTLITEKMGTAINDYVQQAMATGTEVPEAMRPLLQKMIDLGTLTDAAGDKITDLSGIKFSETLTEGFQSIVDAIHELTRALSGDLGGALDTLSRRKVVIPISFETDDAGSAASAAATGGLVTRGRVIPFGLGGFVPRGTDTVPAMLTPGEIVMNVAQQRHTADALLSGANRDAALLAEIRALRQEVKASGDRPVVAQFGTQRFEALAKRAARADLASGRARPRAQAGRSY